MAANGSASLLANVSGRCGFAGLPIRVDPNHISWPEAGFPWLSTTIGACEEYNNATDVLQVFSLLILIRLPYIF